MHEDLVFHRGGNMATAKPRIPLSILNLIALLVVVVVNALAVTLPLGGKTTAQISDMYPNLPVPSGLTFSISAWHLCRIRACLLHQEIGS
jgi:hypothetical protein